MTDRESLCNESGICVNKGAKCPRVGSPCCYGHRNLQKEIVKSITHDNETVYQESHGENSK